MKIYADTSVLVAWFHPADEFAGVVTDWCRMRSPEFCWNPILRIELRHQLRRLSGKYSAAAWHAYRASENTRKLRLESSRLSDLLERGDALSTLHAQSFPAGTWDVVHVAAAQHNEVEVFATCDSAQAQFAKAAGLIEVKLFKC